MTVLELAQKYYPTLWSKERIRTLVANVPPRLTPQEYKQITGEEYTNTMETSTVSA